MGKFSRRAGPPAKAGWKILKEKVVFKRPWFEVWEHKVRLPNGKIMLWDSQKNQDALVIVPVAEDGEVLLIKEWKPVHKGYITTFPAGGIAPREGKSPLAFLQKAREELREEVGLDAKRLEKIGAFTWGGRTGGKIHLFLAKGLFPSPKKGDEGEQYIKVVKMPIKKAWEYLAKKGIKTTAFTLAALALAKERLKFSKTTKRSLLK